MVDSDNSSLMGFAKFDLELKLKSISYLIDNRDMLTCRSSLLENFSCQSIPVPGRLCRFLVSSGSHSAPSKLR